MLACPEVARLVEEFENCTLKEHRGDINHCHHEQHLGIQAAFLKGARSLTAVFEEMGNPFLEKSQPLMVLDTRDIKNTHVVETVRKAEVLGEKQYNMFLEEILVKSMKPITEPLPKNKLALFSHPSVNMSSIKTESFSYSIKG